MKKQYNPNWPFPQYDENGKQLLPPDWFKKPDPYPHDAEEALF